MVAKKSQMEHPEFRFTALEQFQRSDVAILNRGHAYLAGSEQVAKMLKAVGDLLIQYDIFHVEEVEISLLVKPVGHIGKPQVRRILQPEITIGRTNENAIMLKSPIVSKNHAMISRRGLEYYLKDMRSDNGTYLNQVKLDPESEVVLKNDDVIRIDPFEIKIGLPSDLSIVKRPVRIDLAGIRVCRQPEVAGYLAVFFQLQPSSKNAVIRMEEQEARWLIQKIFMGQQDSLASPWTELESGFFEYLICKVLSAINPFLQETRVTLQSIEKKPERFQEWFSKEAPLVESVFTTQTEKGLIYVSLLLPNDMMKERPAPKDFLDRAKWLSHLSYAFSVQVGVAYLSMDQVHQLEEGDIILLDRTTVTLEPEGVNGKAEIHCKQLRRAALRGSLSVGGDGRAQITLEGLYQEGLKGMTEATKKTEETEETGGAEALSSIEIPVTVEFARLNFTLEELSAFKEGQIIELEKSRPELVDLSVDGNVIANGKLVDVEGKLGVQLGKILKAKSKE